MLSSFVSFTEELSISISVSNSQIQENVVSVCLLLVFTAVSVVIIGTTINLTLLHFLKKINTLTNIVKGKGKCQDHLGIITTMGLTF